MVAVSNDCRSLLVESVKEKDNEDDGHSRMTSTRRCPSFLWQQPGRWIHRVRATTLQEVRDIDRFCKTKPQGAPHYYPSKCTLVPSMQCCGLTPLISPPRPTRTSLEILDWSIPTQDFVGSSLDGGKHGELTVTTPEKIIIRLWY